MDKKEYMEVIASLLEARTVEIGIDLGAILDKLDLEREEAAELFCKGLLNSTRRVLRGVMESGVVKHLDLDEFELVNVEWDPEDEFRDFREEPNYLDKEERDATRVAASVENPYSAAITIDPEYLPSHSELAHWEHILAQDGLEPIGPIAAELNSARRANGLDAIEFVQW